MRVRDVVVDVSHALRTNHLGCYGARYVNTRTITSSLQSEVLVASLLEELEGPALRER